MEIFTIFADRSASTTWGSEPIKLQNEEINLCRITGIQHFLVLYHKVSNIAWLQLKSMLINALTVINVDVRTL